MRSGLQASPACRSSPSFYPSAPTAPPSRADYTYQPVLGAFPAPQVFFTWTNVVGKVAIYVTNQYIPGTNALLPGPAFTGTCQWVCTNFTGCSVGPGDPCYTPYNANNGPVLYTIAVVGATGLRNEQSTYLITATNAGDPVQLISGAPTTDIVLFPGSNLTFTFNVGFVAARSDVFVAASVNHGAVTMLISPAFSTPSQPVPTPPTCTGNSPQSCTGWMWMTTSGVGDLVVYLPGVGGGGLNTSTPAPCAPVSPAGTPAPSVNQAWCASTFPTYLLPGTYYVTLFQLGQGPTQPMFSELSLEFADFSRAIPRTMLADGQPLLLQSGPLVVCPGYPRDPSSEACPQGVPSNATLGSVTWFRVPGASPITFLNVVVERLCGGNVTGECGTGLYIGISACPFDGVSCTPQALMPYGADANFSYSMSDAVGGFVVQSEACLPPNYVPPPGGSATPDCIYSVGVWPSASGQAPGVGVGPSTYRVTLSTPMGTERVPQDCPGGGRYCTMPLQVVTAGTYRNYEGYASSVAASTKVTVTAVQCYGATLSVYACTATGSCFTPSTPNAFSYDYSAVTSNTPSGGYAPITPFTSTRDIYFVGVTGTLGALPQPTYQPSYELQMMHGGGLLLGLGAGTIVPSWDATGQYLTVTWPMPTLTGASGALFTLQNAVFIVHAFPNSDMSDANFQLSTPCGAKLAAETNMQTVNSVVLRFVPQAQASCAVGGSCSYTFSRLAINPNTQYRIAVTASCHAGVDPRTGSAPCMPGNQEGQRVAWPWVPDSIWAPSPAPVPASASAAPAPQQPAAAPAKSSPAGAVVATLFALAAVGAGAWFGIGKYYAGGRPAAFEKLKSLVGLGGGGGPTGRAGGMSAHPIFGNGDLQQQEDGGGLLSSDYAAMA